MLCIYIYIYITMIIMMMIMIMIINFKRRVSGRAAPPLQPAGRRVVHLGFQLPSRVIITVVIIVALARIIVIIIIIIIVVISIIVITMIIVIIARSEEDSDLVLEWPCRSGCYGGGLVYARRCCTRLSGGR